MAMFVAESPKRGEVREEVDGPVAIPALDIDISASVDEEEHDRDADAHRSIVVRHVTKQQVVDLGSGGRDD